MVVTITCHKILHFAYQFDMKLHMNSPSHGTHDYAVIDQLADLDIGHLIHYTYPQAVTDGI